MTLPKVGDRVTLNIPESGSNGMPGIVMQVIIMSCGKVHVFAKFDNGFQGTLPIEWVILV